MDFQRELQSKHHLYCKHEKPAHCHGSLLLRLGTCEVGATERGCSGSIGSDDTRGYGAGSGDVGKELPRGMIP